MRSHIVLVFLLACGDDDAESPIDAGSQTADGASVDGASVDATPTCVPIGNAGTQGSDANLFGEIVYFGGEGFQLPAGRYQVRYVGGCMKYGGGQDWTIHAIAVGNQWYLGGSRGEQLATPPGTYGYAVSNGAYLTFAECVAANLALPPVELDFAGGPLGVWLQDSPVSDNTTGEKGQNPTWEIAVADTCPPLADAGAR